MDITSHKKMTVGEMGLTLLSAFFALGALIVAAKAYTPEYAFHAYIFSAAGVAAVLTPGATAEQIVAEVSAVIG